MADVCSIKPKNILIACTGSVATIKLPLLLDLFKKEFCFNGQIEVNINHKLNLKAIIFL